MRQGFCVGQRRKAGAEPDEAARGVKRYGKGAQRGKQADRCHQRPGQTAAQDSVQQKSGERQQRNQPEMQRRVHSFIRSIRSTASVERARNTAMMMARPTAASAAATIMTKKTKI